jgi:DNA-directed RNA polymerase specialized sigma24 family protein
MFKQKELIVIVVAIVLSQLAGQIWIASKVTTQSSSNNDKGLEIALINMSEQLSRIEALQAAKVAVVNPGANTVTMDQSILKDTLREIVADELERVSPKLSAEYVSKAQGSAYVGDTPYMQPEQAFEQSQAIIREAIQYGELSGEKAAEMAPLVNSLTEKQRIQLLEQYHGALSRGEIKISGIVPPL